MSRCSSCGNSISACATCFLDGGSPLCWLCRELRSPLCPYCARDLSVSSSKCAGCGEELYNLKRRSLTRFESIALDELRSSVISPAALFCAITTENWVVPPGPREPRDEWRVAFLQAVAHGRGRGAEHAERTIIDALVRLGSAHNYELSYVAARVIWALGHDYRPLLREFHRQILLSLKQRDDVSGVEIGFTPESCRACKRLRRRKRIWTIDEALAELPLPCPDCTTDVDEDSEGCDDEEEGLGDVSMPDETTRRRMITIGWCRCDFSPILRSSS